MEWGDIYIVLLDPNQSSEQHGMRLVLVVSPASFNRITGMPMVLPITQGGGFTRTAAFAVSLMGIGTSTQGMIRCDRHPGPQRPQDREPAPWDHRCGPGKIRHYPRMIDIGKR